MLELIWTGLVVLFGLTVWWWNRRGLRAQRREQAALLRQHEQMLRRIRGETGVSQQKKWENPDVEGLRGEGS